MSLSISLHIESCEYEGIIFHYNTPCDGISVCYTKPVINISNLTVVSSAKEDIQEMGFKSCETGGIILKN